MRRLSLPNYIRRTGATFERTDRFLDDVIVVDSTKEKLDRAGVPLIQIEDNTYATSTEELHTFVIGDSGCGKTRRVILPTIRMLAKSGESMVVADPKGELYKATANVLKSKGYSVIALNFRNPSKGQRWNPLGLVESLYRAGDSHSRDKALMMLNDLSNVLQESMKSERDPYWAMSASALLRALAQMILEYGNEGELTIENIAIAARQLFEKLDAEESRKKFGDMNVKRGEFLKGIPEDSPIMNNLSPVIVNAESTRNCIKSTFESMISLYESQEALTDLFSRSEFDVRELGLKPTALFFILPDDTEALYPIATVFVKQIYSTLVELADSQPNGKLPNKVTFLLDEFANFAKMPSIESMLTAARSRAIRFVLVCQSMDQLITKYGESGKETLLANCRVWIYMSCRNLNFLERLSKLMGSYISPYTGEKVPLMDVSDLQHLGKEQVLILNDRCRPVVGKLPDYSKYSFGDNDGDVSVLDEIPDMYTPYTRKRFSLTEALRNVNSETQSSRIKAKIEKQTTQSPLRAKMLEACNAPAAPKSGAEEAAEEGGAEGRKKNIADLKSKLKKARDVNAADDDSDDSSDE